MNEEVKNALESIPELVKKHLQELDITTASGSVQVTANLDKLPPLPCLPSDGYGITDTFHHLRSTILPSLAQGHAGPRYYGFVTGGVHPSALLADFLVSTYDQNVQVHLPQSISTTVERHTIRMLCDLLSLGPEFDGTITTGATGSNILGLACAREWAVYQLTRQTVSMTGGGNVRVLCAGGHSSLSKACSILGIGRSNCRDITAENTSASFDLTRLENNLKLNISSNVASIVVATFGEVNTGSFTDEIRTVVSLCTKYKAWLHIDAAFGILARIHPAASHLCDGLDLANSISFDGHKFFNVPYDCGVFLTRDMQTLSHVCGNTGAAYLSSSGDGYSPLNISLENSRRFRALPLYAALLSLGRFGYQSIVQRCCEFAMEMGEQIKLSKKFRLLEKVEFNIVLFQAKGHDTMEANEKVKDVINGTGKLYVSGTTWKGKHALRIAVCNYLTPQYAKSEAEEIINILETAIS